MTESHINDSQKNSILFTNLVLTFHTAALQHLGKIVDPITQKVERNLDAARYSIDILDMLRFKCSNNLSQDETKFLDNVLSELKLNFVDEINRSEPEKKEESAAASNN